ncbi:MAG TPA: hypothetical protein VIX73_05935 [Kofleriaceae bacterium]
MVDPTDTTPRIALARDNLTAKLGELRRREARVRTVLSPMRHLANPWLRVGVAAAIGYRLGRAGPVRIAVEPTSAGSETLFRSIVRAGLVVVAQAVVRRAVAELMEATSVDEPVTCMNHGQ